MNTETVEAKNSTKIQRRESGRTDYCKKLKWEKVSIRRAKKIYNSGLKKSKL